jgi:Ankyrin repeats (3 copies)/Ankyrin repeats (many copies)
MPRRRRAKAETTLVPHRTPNLAALLDEAKTCELAPLRRFLAAGGHPDALVPMQGACDTSDTAPLLFKAVIRSTFLPDYRSSIELLLDAGANINAFISGTEEGAEISPLIAACQPHYTNEPLMILLQRGADVCLRTPSFGVTALHAAATQGYTDKCKLLLAADRRVLEVRTRAGRSAMYAAVTEGQLPVVELLHKDYGADLFAVPDDGSTLLHAAVLAKVPSQLILAYLLHNGLDVNAVTNSSQTPVHVAAERGNAAAV